MVSLIYAYSYLTTCDKPLLTTLPIAVEKRCNKNSKPWNMEKPAYSSKSPSLCRHD